MSLLGTVRSGAFAAHPRFLVSDLPFGVPTAAARRRAIERVSRVAAAPEDARSLRLALLDEIRQSVPFDAYAWLLTDPQTEVGAAPLADVPCLPELPRLIRLKYLTTTNR